MLAQIGGDADVDVRLLPQLVGQPPGFGVIVVGTAADEHQAADHPRLRGRPAAGIGPPRQPLPQREPTATNSARPEWNVA